MVPAKKERRVSISLSSFFFFFFKRKCITHFFTKLITLSESSLVSTTNKLAENISSDTCNRLYYSEDKAPHESIQVYSSWRWLDGMFTSITFSVDIIFVLITILRTADLHLEKSPFFQNDVEKPWRWLVQQ